MPTTPLAQAGPRMEPPVSSPSEVETRPAETETPDWSSLPELARFRFERAVERDGSEKIAAVLSPFMSCEEAWLLARFIRDVAPEATLALGPVPVEGEDEARDLFGDSPRLEKFREKGSALVGDVHPRRVRDVAGWLSPVPGGVGPLTVALLLRNTLQAAQQRT